MFQRVLAGHCRAWPTLGGTAGSHGEVVEEYGSGVGRGSRREVRCVVWDGVIAVSVRDGEEELGAEAGNLG